MVVASTNSKWSLRSKHLDSEPNDEQEVSCRSRRSSCDCNSQSSLGGASHLWLGRQQDIAASCDISNDEHADVAIVSRSSGRSSRSCCSQRSVNKCIGQQDIGRVVHRHQVSVLAGGRSSSPVSNSSCSCFSSYTTSEISKTKCKISSRSACTRANEGKCHCRSYQMCRATSTCCCCTCKDYSSRHSSGHSSCSGRSVSSPKCQQHLKSSLSRQVQSEDRSVADSGAYATGDEDSIKIVIVNGGASNAPYTCSQTNCSSSSSNYRKFHDNIECDPLKTKEVNETGNNSREQHLRFNSNKLTCSTEVTNDNSKLTFANSAKSKCVAYGSDGNCKGEQQQIATLAFTCSSEDGGHCRASSSPCRHHLRSGESRASSRCSQLTNCDFDKHFNSSGHDNWNQCQRLNNKENATDSSRGSRLCTRVKPQADKFETCPARLIVGLEGESGKDGRVVPAQLPIADNIKPRNADLGANLHISDHDNQNQENGDSRLDVKGKNCDFQDEEAAAKMSKRSSPETSSPTGVRNSNPTIQLKLAALMGNLNNPQELSAKQNETDNQLRANKHSLSRSGSRCSSVSSVSTNCLSACTSFSIASSDMSHSSNCCQNLSRSPIAEIPSEEVNLAIKLTSDVKQKEVENNNNNDGDFPNAYDEEASVTLPPPPPPPPPMPRPGELARLQPINLRPTLKGVDDSGSNIATESSGVSTNQVKAKSTKLILGSNSMATFIPPQFSAPPKDGTNIKPSEYLKRMASNSALSTVGISNKANCPTGKLNSLEPSPIGSLSSATGSSVIPKTTSPGSISSSRRVFDRSPNHQNSNRFSSQKSNKFLGTLTRSQSTSALSTIMNEQDDLDEFEGNTKIELETSEDAELESCSGCSGESESGTTNVESDDPIDDPKRDDLSANLMSAIRNLDKSRDLKKCIDPLSDQSAKTNGKLTTSKEPTFRLDDSLAATKRDLIAELKESKNLDGIKKMREHSRSKGELNQIIASSTPVFKAEDFLDKLARDDPQVPLWRRQMLAKKAAEKARKHHEDQLRREMEEQRLSQVPAWKRQMLAKKAAERNKRDSLDKEKRQSEEKRLGDIPAWRRQLVRTKLNVSTGNMNTISDRLVA